MTPELQELLKKNHNLDLFVKFLQAFRCYHYRHWEAGPVGPATTVGFAVQYRKTDDGPLITFMNARRSAFVYYRFYESSIEEITRDFKRFLSLKAFI